MQTNDHKTGSQGGTRRRFALAAIGLTATAVLTLAAATPALASPSASKAPKPAVGLIVITPMPGDVAGAGGVFNVDLALVALNGKGNSELSAANGYKPGINSTGKIGQPDPSAPGLVVLLSTTPGAAGGPHANLAGVFQLTDVAVSHGLHQVFADWEVGKPGAFGKGSTTTLTAFLVKGTAPGAVTSTAGAISNVIYETFTIGR